jgi:two-component system LytT family response regulator
MNIIILDDEETVLGTEAALIRGFGHNVAAFSSAVDILEFYGKNPNTVDAAILDILLGKKEPGGIETARELRAAGFEGPVVFLSSSKEYGPESYEVNAAGYVEKPVTAEKISQVLGVVSGIIERRKIQNEPYLIIINGKAARKLLFCDILYVEITRNTLNFHITGGEIVSVRAPLKEYAPALLADGRFAESHRAFIVNLDYVAAIKGCEAILLDGSKVLVAKTQTGFKEKFIRSKLSGGF